MTAQATRSATWALVATLWLTVSGCVSLAQRTAGELRGADQLDYPISVGPQSHELKRSPCACIPVPLKRPGPQIPA